MPPDDRWRTPLPARLPAALTPFVRTLQGYGATGMVPSVHRGLPGHTLTFVLALDDGLEVAPTTAAFAAGRLERHRAVLGGLHTEPAVIVQPGRWSGLQVDVSPLGARRLFGVPAAALPTDHYDAAAVLGVDLDRLHDQLGGAAGWPERYAVVTRWLSGRLAASEPGRAPRAVVQAWRLLERHGGAVEVGALAEQVGLDRRRLARVFVAELGVAPRTVGRLIRFQGARRDVGAAAAAPGPLDLSGVAARHGNYDHAHLVRDFRAFSGLSPTRWVAAERANVQAAPAGPAAGSAS
ncbi:helix-turn-helix domain-containing protein [Microlunatus lacustris]